jgi:hypothetical protein
MSDCPSTNRSGLTRDTNSDASATLNAMLSVPAPNVTAYSSHKVSTCSAYRTGMAANSAARPRSAVIIVARRRPRRSTQAPAGSPNSRLGTHSSAVRYPIWAAPACSTSTAASGSAITEIWSPNIEIVDALQYRRNATSRSSSGISRDLTSGPDIARERDVQVGDPPGAGRPELGPDQPLGVPVDELLHLAAELR